MSQNQIANNGTTVVPLRGARAMIAQKMVSSLQQGAQLTHHSSCDATGLLAYKARLANDGHKVSVEDIINLCIVEILQRHPDINGTIDGKQIELSSSIDLCVAIALPGNLLVAPTIFNAGEKELAGLRASRQDLSRRANTNKLTVTEMTTGTFTVSNLGLTRVEHFTPIVNSPQIAILGIGCTIERAVREADGAVAFRSYIGLSLSFDHRAIDGGPAANALTDLCHTIEALE